MAKLKTNRAAKKRFKVLKSGKVKRRKATLRHILTSKPKARKRNLRKSTLIHDADMKAIKALFPYDR